MRDQPSGGEGRALEVGVGGFSNPEPCRLFRWRPGEVVTASAGAGPKVTVLEEYPHSNGERHFARMREGTGRRMLPPEDPPLMYGVRAENPTPETQNHPHGVKKNARAEIT